MQNVENRNNGALGGIWTRVSAVTGPNSRPGYTTRAQVVGVKLPD